MTSPSTIAHYRVTSKLGEGGMGAVYRATDTKLNRSVAIKVLPESYAVDPDRLARFTREAQVLASLNHPNIAAIYGVEERALVLELVEGPTLADRIAAGPVPVEEALAIARQIAEALEYAHEKGIIHRDLKPANVKVTPDGKVKVLDFGLAKAFAPDASAADPMSSPTMTMRATLAGVIMGTPGYMSPEQARGKPVDRRTDIWAFGCVLFELLTGQRIFSGESLTDYAVVAATRDPDWSALPPGSPVELLRLCLQKDPQRRLRDIGDAALISAIPPAPSTSQTVVRPVLSSRLPWAICAVMTLVAAALGLGFALSQKPAVPRAVARFTLPLAPMSSLSSFVVSPDGRRIAVAGSVGSALNQLFLRQLDGNEFKPVPGTSGAELPFFSPDGEWIGFLVNDKLQKIPAGGGQPTVLASNAYGGAVWVDGEIITSIWDQGGASSLVRIPLGGGGARPLGVSSDSASYQYWPTLLPEGRGLLFTDVRGNARVNLGDNVALAAFGPGNSKPQIRTLTRGGSPLYVPTGHILFLRGTDLMALPFDLGKLQVTGPEFTVLQGVGRDTSSGKAYYNVSRDGTLFYWTGVVDSTQNTLVWVDRTGKAQPMAAPGHDYWDPRVSPDGKHVAVLIREGDSEIWNFGTERGTLTRITFDPDEDETPAWSPDGEWIAYSSARKGKRLISRRRTDGSGAEEVLWTTEHHAHIQSWSPDGRTLLISDRGPDTVDDIWALEFDAAGKPKARPLLNSRFHETQARLSPDGKWLAYVSDETGRPEIYVQSFPAMGGKQQVSSQGGQQPAWGPGGRELFYRSGSEVMAVTIAGGKAFSPSVPHSLFPDTFFEPREWDHAYFDVSSDGRRFVMVKATDRPKAAAQLNVVVNWFEELKAKGSQQGK